MKRYADVISGTMLIVIGAFLLNETRYIRALMPMRVGPHIMPQIYTVGLIIFGGVIAVSGWLRVRKSPHTAQSSHLGSINKSKVALTMGLLAFYAAALRPLGFLVTSIAYLFFQIIVLGGGGSRRRLLLAAVLSVLVTFGIYHLFYTVFNIFLPPGRIW